MKLLYLVFLLSFITYADNATFYNFPDGRTIALTSDGNISMQAESVYIRPSTLMTKIYNRTDTLPLISVHCVFKLVNNSDEGQSVTVGFPIDANFGEEFRVMNDLLREVMNDSINALEGRSQWFTTGLSDGLNMENSIPGSFEFTSTLNGEKLPIYYRSCAFSIPEQLIHQPVVALWKMSFKPEEIINLVNTYNTNWEYFNINSFNRFTFNYNRTTGGTWSGPIRDAVIILEVPDEIPPPSLTDMQVAYWDWSGSPQVSGNTVTWHLNNSTTLENVTFSAKFQPLGELLCNEFSYLDAALMYESISWNEDNILNSVASYIYNSSDWHGQSLNTELLLRIAEALPYIANECMPPNRLDTSIFGSPSLSSQSALPPDAQSNLQVIQVVKDKIQLDIELVHEAGYTEFLPMFIIEFDLTERFESRYAAMPEKQEKFLELLEYYEDGKSGIYIDDPAIRAFYGLTGWSYPRTQG